MEISVIQIGNSKGIRLSKTILEKYEIRDTIELILKKEFIILKPKTSPRKGWEKALIKMHNRGDDRLFINDIFENEKPGEWK